ncbi:peptidoglycan-binding domain-containing protein [Nioella nitratireducens]|uniref:peptidoglycan-binding domain-containing protein n=1 Tax=Nioella nitratireducens TaxID=1287720 RepID=UPI0008FD7FB3|nr:peptidoglycan-binding domain-containing protein [Nioella nitratireducens]
MFKVLTAAAFTVSLAAFPAPEARADAGDVVGGLIVGGLIGAAIANDQNSRRNNAAAAAANRPSGTVYHGIPATQMGRDTQTALNYFGFNAGSVDGQIGTGTRTAIERYQGTMGYPVNGRDYPSYQYNTLMNAYYWAVNGGSAQTGLVGQPLLIHYRNAQVAPQQQPQVVVVPQAGGQPAPQVVAQPPVQTTIVPAPATASSK